LADDPTVAASDDTPLIPTLESRKWSDLLKLPRVVVLSEAGSGKTEEIRHTAQRLRREGKPAFFLRLEHIPTEFETAFEEGTYEEFERWERSGQEGWLLLDSIDEARLRDPQEFAAAVRILAGRLKFAMPRAHILLTGRTAAWRPLSDLELCARHFPYASPDRAQEVGGDAADAQHDLRTRVTRNKAGDSGPFTVVALDDLTVGQVRLFAQARQAPEVDRLLDALERADGWSFTTRPLDLEDLLEFWSGNRRLGSRLELLRSSIERRLREADQNRDEVRPLPADKARVGARLLAAACTLTQQQTIAVPDRGQTVRGLRLEALLGDWSAGERATLLQRPLFDEEIYGTVRFHHRSVREYLAAEWFSGLLLRNTSRLGIERLFFRKQYGLEVVPPGMRPVLSWLAILDQQVQEKAGKLAPDVLLSGGDPSQLSLATRQGILRETCAHLASGAPRHLDDYAAIQRFAAADLADDIKRSLEAYKDEESQVFLLRMVWQGRLAGAMAQTMAVALSPTAVPYARRVAVRAVRATGSEADLAKIRAAVLAESKGVDRAVVAELLEFAPATPETVGWIEEALARAADSGRYQADHLGEAICEFVGRLDVGDLPRVVELFNRFLERRPVLERGDCEISTRYSWLLKPVAIAVQRLLLARDVAALGSATLAALHKLPTAREYDLVNLDSGDLQIEPLVKGWSDLKFALFWFTVRHSRRRLERKGQKLTDWWSAGLWRSYVSFEPQDFERALDDVTSRKSADDKLVALSLSFKLYVESGRRPDHRRRLRAACAGHQQLGERLETCLHPPRQSPESAKFRRMNAEWKRRSKARAATVRRNEKKWLQYLQENTASLRDPGLEPSAVTNAQYYLHERMRSMTKGSSAWSDGKWRSLEPEFGVEVAEAFRDGAVAHWRKYRPVFISEGAAVGTTPFSVIFGLAGLFIDSTETAGWAAKLTDSDVELVFRYAMHELNGFPPWFPAVFALHPALVRDLALTEVAYELSTEQADKDSHYLIYDINWSGEWLWDSVAPQLIAWLSAADSRNLRNLQHLLNIIQGSSASDADVAHLARSRAPAAEDLGHIAQWYAVWTGAAPGDAIPALEARLDGLASDADRLKVVMAYLAELVGSRRGEVSRVRRTYCTAQHLKTLYLLAHRHVRRRDDIDRANGGVYSPGQRDHAQDAREHLLSLLRALPGKEAYAALSEIAHTHPDETLRPFITAYAKSKAELDSAHGPWTEAQVREFNDEHERTPSSHRDLFELAVVRLLDLKADLEDGDSSDAPMLARVGIEVEIRAYIGNWLRNFASGRYAVPQEEELADAKRPDLRVHGIRFDAPVPLELKLADNWSGPELFERLEVQLCGDYLRDPRSTCGVYLLVYRGEKSSWRPPGESQDMNFEALVEALQSRWLAISPVLPNVEDVRVVGIDLTRRLQPRSR